MIQTTITGWCFDKDGNIIRKDSKPPVIMKGMITEEPEEDGWFDENDNWHTI